MSYVCLCRLCVPKLEMIDSLVVSLLLCFLGSFCAITLFTYRYARNTQQCIKR